MQIVLEFFNREVGVDDPHEENNNKEQNRNFQSIVHKEIQGFAQMCFSIDSD